jgi:dienelactone hydrolase
VYPIIFRWRTGTKGVWMLGVLGLELSLGAGLDAASAGLLAGTGIVVAAHLLAVMAFLVGGRAEKRQRAYSRLTSDVRTWRWRVSTGHPFRGPAARIGTHAGLDATAGDVALAGAVYAQHPPYPRLLHASGSMELRRWQRLAARGVRALYVPAPDDEVPMLERFESTDVGGVRRVSVAMRAADGTMVPGFLFEHAPAAGARPAVLVVPGHGPGIHATAGLVDSYEQAAALRLALAGYVVLTIELRGFGLLGDRLGLSHETVATNAVLAGSSYAGVLVRDLTRAVAALAAHPDVDADRVGVTGCSLGGDLALTVAALCPSVRAVVVQGGLEWKDLGGRRPPVTGQGHYMLADRCWMIPGENAHMWREDRWLLVAPRPMLLVNASGDVHDMAERGNWLVDRLRQVYAACGTADAFDFRVETGAHQYFVQPAIAFFGTHL